MSLDFGYLLKYRQMLLTELEILLLLTKWSDIYISVFSDGSVYFLIDSERAKVLPSWGPGSIHSCKRVSLIALMNLYYDETLGNMDISRRLNISEISFYKIADYYELGPRPEPLYGQHRQSHKKETDYDVGPRQLRRLLVDPKLPKRSDFVTPGDLLHASPEKAAKMIDRVLAEEATFSS